MCVQRAELLLMLSWGSCYLEPPAQDGLGVSFLAWARAVFTCQKMEMGGHHEPQSSGRTRRRRGCGRHGSIDSRIHFSFSVSLSRVQIFLLCLYLLPSQQASLSLTTTNHSRPLLQHSIALHPTPYQSSLVHAWVSRRRLATTQLRIAWTDSAFDLT